MLTWMLIFKIGVEGSAEDSGVIMKIIKPHVLIPTRGRAKDDAYLGRWASKAHEYKYG